jgi:hypothetical protein
MVTCSTVTKEVDINVYLLSVVQANIHCKALPEE